VPLEKIVNPLHPLVILAEKIKWERFEKELGFKFCESNGAPAKPTRLMVGLHYLKHACNLSDEKTVERWVENPYWQHFSGMKYFMHQAPIDPSLMTRWRKMFGEGGMEKLLSGTIAVGFEMKVITGKSLESVNIDATVQEKAIPYPADAGLFHAMLKRLARLAKRQGVKLRQTYGRVSGKALVKSGRYFHARQNERATREIRRLNRRQSLPRDGEPRRFCHRRLGSARQSLRWPHPSRSHRTGRAPVRRPQAGAGVRGPGVQGPRLRRGHGDSHPRPQKIAAGIAPPRQAAFRNRADNRPHEERRASWAKLPPGH
jgi:hypothetical protein